MREVFFLNQSHELPRTTKTEQRRRRKGLPPSKNQVIRNLEHEIKRLNTENADLKTKYEDSLKAFKVLTGKLEEAEHDRKELSESRQELLETNRKISTELASQFKSHMTDIETLKVSLEESSLRAKFWSEKFRAKLSEKVDADADRASKDLVFGAIWRAQLRPGEEFTEAESKGLREMGWTSERLSEYAAACGIKRSVEIAPEKKK